MGLNVKSYSFYDNVSELGVLCGIFYVGPNRCRILFCCDCYYVLCDTTHFVLYYHELYVCVHKFMDELRSRFGGLVM